MAVRCKVCNNAFLRATVDRLLDEKMTYAGISRYAGEAGIDVTADVVSRHAEHYAPPPERAKGTSKRDFAILIRDSAYTQVENGELALNDAKLVPGINAGLKAQAILDQREKQKTKQQSAELAFAIIQMLSGGATQAPQLEDGLTLEGEYEDISDGVPE